MKSKIKDVSGTYRVKNQVLLLFGHSCEKDDSGRLVNPKEITRILLPEETMTITHSGNDVSVLIAEERYETTLRHFFDFEEFLVKQ